MEEKIFFKSKDGTMLCGIWSRPGKNNGKAVILAHGITVNKDEDGLFPILAAKLTDLGYSVFRFDFRGHGERRGEWFSVTVNGEVTDLESAYLQVKKNRFNKIGLLGASFGGGIASILAAKSQIKLDFLCLWYPVLNYDHAFINPYLPWLKDKIRQMKTDLKIKGFTFLPNEKPFKIGRDLYDDMKIYYPYKELTKVKIPAVIIHGDRDTYVPFSDSEKYILKMKGITKLIAIQGADHGFSGKSNGSFERVAIEKTVQCFRKYF